MTRNPNDDLSFERRRVARTTWAAFVLLWLALAGFGAAGDPAPAPAGEAASEAGVPRQALQTPEEPEPGSGDFEDEFGEEVEEEAAEPPSSEPEPPAPDSLTKSPGVIPDSLTKTPVATPDSLGKLPGATTDSLRKFPAATLPSGAAPMETLGVTKPAVGASRAGAGTTAAPPKERGTIFGLHPAVFFAALIVGHVFIVRAVTD